MLKLFNFNYVEKSENQNILTLATPLGEIFLDVSINDLSLKKTPPTFLGEVSKTAYVNAWALKNIQIELLRVFINPELPPGMNITNCVAYMWRFKNLSKAINLTFQCRLMLKTQVEGEPESGEDLIAQSWGHKTARLTIGTEDEECLFYRAKKGIGLPVRLAKENLLIPETIEYLRDGVEILLPVFQEGEEGQVQFIVAWVEGKGFDDCSTWFAVDLEHQKIIDAALQGNS